MSESLSTNKLFSIAGKIALVTGGSRGIGLMIARGYVENGVKVYISSRKAEVCDAVAKELSEYGECYSLPADLSTNDGRKALITELQQREKSLDILVNNAGAAWGAAFEEYPEAGYDKVMEINGKAVFMLTRDLMPLLTKGASTEDPARVINIGSIDGIKVSFMENFAYGPSKAMIHHLTQNLAVHLGHRGVTFNAIAPGLFKSKMTEFVLDKFQKSVEKKCPMGRIGKPEDMAGLAIYLASPAASYVNGTVITLDGGLSLV